MELNDLIATTERKIKAKQAVLNDLGGLKGKSLTSKDLAYYQAVLKILNAVEREAVGEQVNPEEDFYCTEHDDFGELKCKSQCPYCERVS